MTDTLASHPTPTTHSSRTSKTGGGEKTAWWITFGVLTVTLVAMLSLWN
jgi:hypothetical protein